MKKRWENSDGMNNLHSDNCHLILLILQLAKCLLCFLYLVASFSNKNKGECKLFYVRPQQHSTVYQLKSVWTVNHGPVTIVFSVLQTMTSSSCLLVSFCGKLKDATKCFYFHAILILYCWKNKQCNNGWCAKPLQCFLLWVFKQMC